MSTFSAAAPAPFPVTVHPFKSPTPYSCAYEQGSSSSKNALVFIGGLGDGPHTVPYVHRVAKELESWTKLSYSVFETRLRSSFGGFGYRRLQDDAADISALVKYLHGIGKQKVVLMGHSTGCQVRHSTANCLEDPHLLSPKFRTVWSMLMLQNTPMSLSMVSFSRLRYQIERLSGH